MAAVWNFGGKIKFRPIGSKPGYLGKSGILSKNPKTKISSDFRFFRKWPPKMEKLQKMAAKYGKSFQLVWFQRKLVSRRILAWRTICSTGGDFFVTCLQSQSTLVMSPRWKSGSDILLFFCFFVIIMSPQTSRGDMLLFYVSSDYYYYSNIWRPHDNSKNYWTKFDETWQPLRVPSEVPGGSFSDFQDGWLFQNGRRKKNTGQCRISETTGWISTQLGIAVKQHWRTKLSKKKFERISKWPPKMATKISRFFKVVWFQRKLICWLFWGWRTSYCDLKYSGVTFVIARNCNSSYYVAPMKSGSDILLFYCFFVIIIIIIILFIL